MCGSGYLLGQGKGSLGASVAGPGHAGIAELFCSHSYSKVLGSAFPGENVNHLPQVKLQSLPLATPRCSPSQIRALGGVTVGE